MQMKGLIFSLILLVSWVCAIDLDPKTRVILIGIDGLLKKCLFEANHSAFDYLAREGSSTLKARTAIETVSGPGWSNILCGMSTEETGISDNSWVAPWLFRKPAKLNPYSGDKNAFPCLFSELKRHNKDLKTMMTYDWDWFINLGNIAVPGSVDRENFCDALNPEVLGPYIECDKQMLQNGLESIREDFDLSFIYFGALDEAGHMTNFCSKEYIDVISSTNSHIETIIAELKSLGIYDNTYIIVTTDHGASYMKKRHGQQDDDNMEIPFYIVGPGIKKGYEITDLVKNQDVTPTILHMFGYPPNKLWRSRVVSDAFDVQDTKLKFKHLRNEFSKLIEEVR